MLTCSFCGAEMGPGWLTESPCCIPMLALRVLYDRVKAGDEIPELRPFVIRAEDV